MGEVAYLVYISGRVTGVGFRYSALDFASDMPRLKGYVRNVGYGRVEAFVQGPEEDVEKMLGWLRDGSGLARIDNIQIMPATPDPGCEKFRIR